VPVLAHKGSAHVRGCPPRRVASVPQWDPRWRHTGKRAPLHGQLLRTQNPAVTPGGHVNKDPWTTVTLDRRVLDEELSEWIDESHALVVRGLSRKARAALQRSA